MPEEKPYYRSEWDKEGPEESFIGVYIRFTKRLTDSPILREELKRKGLEDLSIIKFAMGRTNLPVTEREWNIMKGLIESV